ncbi:MAG: tetratricopeptide repeat protein [Bryobacteraceae bacterium]|jgi:tetratricopeptide (TPR) repeat protein
MTFPKPALPAAMAPREAPLWTGYATLVLIAVAVYANSLANGFITDDKLQLLGNPLVTDIHKLPHVFGSGVWSFLGYRGNYYRPVQFVLYALLYWVFGPHALGFHCFMVVLHAANTALVYALALRLLNQSTPAAWISAAVFAVHPIHTEAVDWIAALPDVLLTTLSLAGLLAFVRQNGLPNRLQAAGHCGLYLLALLTKETGVMLLPLYVGYQWIVQRWIVQGKSAAAMSGPLRRRNARLYAGMAAALAIYLVLRVHALGALAPAQQAFLHLTPAAFAMSAAVIAASYLGGLVWPAGLNFFHIFHATSQATPQLVFALAALAAAAWVALRMRARQPMVSYSIFWIALTIAPVLNLAGVGQNVFAERYLYLPSVGFVWLAGMAWAWLRTTAPPVAWPAAAAILLACSVEGLMRNADWKDDYTLLQATLKQSPKSGYLHNLMAGVWIERDQFRRALDEQTLAVRYEPRSVTFRKNLGNILLGMDAAAAAREFETVTQLQPSLAEGHLDLGLAYQTLGDSERAAAEYERALALAPDYLDALLALAQLDRTAGKTEESQALFRRAEAIRRRLTDNAGATFPSSRRPQ